MISNCSHDENGRYSGGAAGDQGGEWVLRDWYNRPWNVMLRHPDPNVRAKICEFARSAALNDKIGYDQNQRYTFWEHLVTSDYDPAKITVKCETDCSAGVLAIVKAVGYKLGIAALKNVSQYGYTGNQRAILKAAGFQVFTDSKYLNSDNYLLKGDILLNESHHTCINVSTGIKTTEERATAPVETPIKTQTAPTAESGPDKPVAGTYIATTDVNMRTKPVDGSVITVVPKNATVTCYGYYTFKNDRKWLLCDYKCDYKGYIGFVSERCLQKR